MTRNHLFPVEYPAYVCSDFNDPFVAAVDTPLATSAAGLTLLAGTEERGARDSMPRLRSG